MPRLRNRRIHYAQLVTAIGGVDSKQERLISAFASVRREDFLGPGPWRIRAGAEYVETPTDDPAFLYADVLVALPNQEKINNGQPSLHARCINALNIKSGESIIHIGAGTGYYSAILVEMIGPTGSVIAYEIDEELARLASNNLASQACANVQNHSGTAYPLPACDVIYVNAGVTGPPETWLDALNPGGRLLFPLTNSESFGAMLLIERKDKEQFSAKFISQASFIPCIGARDEKTAFGLTEAFQSGKARDVKSFHQNTKPDDSCWFATDNWWLSTTQVK